MVLLITMLLHGFAHRWEEIQAHSTKDIAQGENGLMDDLMFSQLLHNVLAAMAWHKAEEDVLLKIKATSAGTSKRYPPLCFADALLIFCEGCLPVWYLYVPLISSRLEGFNCRTLMCH